MRVLFFIICLLISVAPALADETYMCPMHPHISGEQGDTCPICGMSLVPKTSERPSADKKSHTSEEKTSDAHYISPRFVQALGVKIEEVQTHRFGRSIQAFGQIKASTRREHVVDVRTGGWIVDLTSDAIGDDVEKGDLLFTYYSPELMSAQSDYLLDRRGGRTIGDPERRLRLFGMDDHAIAELNKRDDYLDATPFYAPAKGTVTELNARPGAYLPDGATLMRIQDFSQVWVEADVALKDIAFLKNGTPATVLIPETNEEWQSDIALIHPITDPDTRTVRVRLVLDNPQGRLRPGAYAEVSFSADETSRVAVPSNAVLYGPERAYVIKALGDGFFRPVQVKPGITSRNMTEIKTGLSPGDQIVASGQFLIDSESNLNSSMERMKKDPDQDQASMEEHRHREH